MTDKEVMQQALEALVQLDGLDTETECVTIDLGDVITALKAALEQQAEPVSQAVIAGALFDFMGWLTTRKERLVLSSTDNASPAADAIKVFAEMRGLSLNDARVQDWQNYTTQQQAEPPQRPWVGLTDEEILSTDPWEILRADPWMGTSDSNINPYQILLKVRTLEAKLKERNA